MLIEHFLDLAGLDSIPSNLHLVIRAAQELYATVRPVTCDVTSTIESGVRVVGERVLDEPLRCQLRPIEIAASHSSPANHQFSRHSHRHWLEVLVANVDLCVRDRAADRDAPLLSVELVGRGPNRGFCWTVHIEDVALDHAAQFRCE